MKEGGKEHNDAPMMKNNTPTNGREAHIAIAGEIKEA